MRKILTAVIFLASCSASALAQDIYSAPSVVGTSLPGQVPATQTNDTACSTCVGALISSTILVGSAVSLTTNTSTDVTSVPLTGGDWRICGSMAYNLGASTVVTAEQGWTSTTSATVPTTPNNGSIFGAALTFPVQSAISTPVGCQRVSVATSATAYLSVRLTFTTSTAAAYGYLSAERVR